MWWQLQTFLLNSYEKYMGHRHYLGVIVDLLSFFKAWEIYKRSAKEEWNGVTIILKFVKSFWRNIIRHKHKTIP